MRAQATLHFWFEELTPKQHFVTDPALDETIRARFGATLEAATRCELFAYMPYMHSESALVHTQAVALFSQPGMEGNLDFELRHQAIITRFGRYPHRNAVLGVCRT